MSDARTSTLDVESVAGAFTGRYRIRSKLGEGGMAAVFLADDERLGRRVAVKVLKPDLGQQVGEERFLRETDLAAKLSHPHIAPVLDRGEADGLLYFIMPVVEGTTLREILDEHGPLPIPDAVRYMRYVAGALEYAHDHGVVHRDVKPENVIVDGRHAIVMDFGVAKAASSAAPESEVLTRAGIMVGTPAYVAPEQAAGSAEVDGRADIYALGAMVYELVTGRPPFTGTVQQVLAGHLARDPEPPSVHRPDLPPALDAVLLRCLAKEPGDRYADATALLEALEGLGDAGRATVTRDAATRPSRWVGVAAVAAVLVVAVMAVLRPGADGPGTEGPVAVADPGNPRIVVLPFRNAGGDEGLDGAGLLAAEWVTQALYREEIGRTVPASTVSQLLASLDSSEGPPDQAIVEETDADLVVSGSVLRSGDQVVLSADVSDARTGELVGTVEPVQAADVTDAVTLMARRVQALMATRLNIADPIFRLRPPPDMQVYDEVRRGRNAFYRGDFPEAVSRLGRVGDMAPDYLSYTPYLAGALYWLGEYAAADSLIDATLLRASELTANERSSLEHLSAWVNGDLEAEYQVTRARGSDFTAAVYNHALAALRSNRPRAALEAVASADLDSPAARDWSLLWAIAPAAYHMLGDYQASLEAARRARVEDPRSRLIMEQELSALAALGRAAAVDSLLVLAEELSAIYVRPPQDTQGWSMVRAALEFDAHGDPEAARTWADRAADWYAEAVGSTARADQGLLYGQALASYVARDYPAARRQFEALRSAHPDDLQYLGFLGVLAVRSGDATEARRIREVLAAEDRPYLFGLHTRWLARMAALRGDTERSLELLRTAFSEGSSLGLGQDWYWLHLDPDLAAVRETDDYRRWVAPRD